MNLRQLPVFPTIVVLAAVATMIALGVWQLGRADEKAAMIARFEASANLPAVELRDLREASDLLYRVVRLDCSRAWRWEAVAGRNQRGQSGYVHRYMCLQQSVNRYENDGNSQLEVAGVIGWSRGPESPAWRGGTLEGVLAPMGENYKLVSSTGLSGLERAARPNPRDLPNNHLAYAGQWFFFALTALVIYWLAIRKRLGERRDGET